MRTVFDVVLFAAGYVASICSWPMMKIRIHGASAEATDLRQTAARLEARLRRL